MCLCQKTSNHETQDMSLDGRMLLIETFQKLALDMWAVLNWLWMWSNGGHLWAHLLVPQEREPHGLLSIMI
jgi:hypothetical protein